MEESTKRPFRLLDTIQTKGKLNEVVAVDLKGKGNAHHEYAVVHAFRPDLEENVFGEVISKIKFQNGPRTEKLSIPGVLDTDLLEIVRDRLTSFQQGPFACKYNQRALEHVEEALRALNARVEDRMKRDVLGTDEK